MKTVFEHPKALSDVLMHYCPGCTHGIAHRLVAEVLDELGVCDNTIGVAPVGCAGDLAQGLTHQTRLQPHV